MEEYTRHSVAEANAAHFQVVRCVESVPFTEGDGTFEWEYCHPAALLELMVEQSPRLRALYAQAASKHLLGQWSLVVAFDEYVPGSKFALDRNRKSMNGIGCGQTSKGRSAEAKECAKTKIRAKARGKGWG